MAGNPPILRNLHTRALCGRRSQDVIVSNLNSPPHPSADIPFLPSRPWAHSCTSPWREWSPSPWAHAARNPTRSPYLYQHNISHVSCKKRENIVEDGLTAVGARCFPAHLGLVRLVADSRAGGVVTGRWDSRPDRTRSSFVGFCRATKEEEGLRQEEWRCEQRKRDRGDLV
jgi:hypothetical protein